MEVTDEMIDASMRYFNNFENAKQNDRDWIAGVIKIVIELHEANKPKPEPVAFMFKSDKHQDGVFFLANTYPMNGTPVYTAPPTREPLSVKEVDKLVSEWQMNSHPAYSLTNLIRAVEQAHGIGV